MRYFKVNGSNVVDIVYYFEPVGAENWLIDYDDIAVAGMVYSDGVLSEPAESIEFKISNLKKVRDSSLSAIVHDFGDGRVVQVRPRDISTFQLAISVGVGEDWVMADNSVEFLTVAELQTAMNSGIAQGKDIWKTYTDALKAL